MPNNHLQGSPLATYCHRHTYTYYLHSLSHPKQVFCLISSPKAFIWNWLPVAKSMAISQSSSLTKQHFSTGELSIQPPWKNFLLLLSRITRCWLLLDPSCWFPLLPTFRRSQCSGEPLPAIFGYIVSELSWHLAGVIGNWWSGTKDCLYSEMITINLYFYFFFTTMNLVNIITSCSYKCFSCMRTFKIYSLNNSHHAVHYIPEFPSVYF